MPECKEVVRARGLCEKHYQGWKFQANISKVCEVTTCGRSRNGGAKGLCISHYHRHLRGEPVDVEIPRRRKKGEGTVTRDGYVKKGAGGGQFFDHRLVMEKVLGRKLRRHETVHHKNGDRADNRVGNLELWSSHQPYGQRVLDKLAWAREIIAEYGPLEGKLRKAGKR